LRLRPDFSRLALAALALVVFGANDSYPKVATFSRSLIDLFRRDSLSDVAFLPKEKLFFSQRSRLLTFPVIGHVLNLVIYDHPHETRARNGAGAPQTPILVS